MSDASNKPTPGDLKRLLDAAKSAVAKAYAPYSRQRVGAAVLGDDGEIYIGVNVENAVNGASVCAEQMACGSARAHGVQKPRAIAIAGERERPLPPCGVCRQVLSEFLDEKTPILSVGKKGEPVNYTLNELLPFAYGPKDLPK